MTEDWGKEDRGRRRAKATGRGLRSAESGAMLMVEG